MKISIITATYNSAATVRDTIESVLRQTYKDVEYNKWMAEPREHYERPSACFQAEWNKK